MRSFRVLQLVLVVAILSFSSLLVIRYFSTGNLPNPTILLLLVFFCFCSLVVIWLLQKTKSITHTLVFSFCYSFVFFCGFAAIELVFGTWLKDKTVNRLAIPTNLEYEFKLLNLYPSESGVSLYRRDIFGLRGIYTKPDTIDVLTVGGSTTDQRYISEGQTWQDFLRLEFQKAGKNVEVVNAGVDGQSTFGHLSNFDYWFPLIPNLKPKYILYYVGLNDFYKEEGNNYDNLSEQNGKSTIKRFQRTVKNNSVSYYLFRTLLGAYTANAYGLDHDLKYKFSMDNWTTEPLLKDNEYEELMSRRLESYEARLQLLCKKTFDMGATPIFVTQTTRRFKRSGDTVSGENTAGIVDAKFGGLITYTYEGKQFNGVDFYFMLRALNDRTIKVAADCEAIALDLAADLENDFDIVNDYYDPVHNSPSGAAKIGKYLFEKLNELL